MASNTRIPLVADKYGYVAGFHDAEIKSVHQHGSIVDIEINLVCPTNSYQLINIRLEDIYYIYYTTGFIQNVILSLSIFENISDIDSASLDEYGQLRLRAALEILNRLHPLRRDPYKGYVLYAEPCAENELLVQCASISAEFVK